MARAVATHRPVEGGTLGGACGSRGGPLRPRNALAIIGLASGDEALTHHFLGLLERREEGVQGSGAPGRPGTAVAA